MSVPSRFNVLIVDPESGSRGKLKQAAMSLGKFNKIHTVSAISEAMSKTDGLDPIDVVFLSYRFSEDDIQSCIKRCRETKAGADWAFVLVVKASEQSNEKVANALMKGANGFLFEPYAADDLRAIAELTAQVKLGNEARRKKAGALMLFREMIEHLDAYAFLKSKGRETKLAKKRLDEKAKALATMKSADQEMYVDAAIEAFENAQPRSSETYRGVSQRVRERLEQKALKEIEAKYGIEN